MNLRETVAAAMWNGIRSDKPYSWFQTKGEGRERTEPMVVLSPSDLICMTDTAIEAVLTALQSEAVVEAAARGRYQWEKRDDAKDWEELEPWQQTPYWLSASKTLTAAAAALEGGEW